MHRKVKTAMKTSVESRAPAERRAKAQHVVERRRISKRPAVIAAVGDRQHPERERYRRAAAAAAAAFD